MERFKAELQNGISVADKEWNYTVPDLQSLESPDQGYIKSVELILSRNEQRIYLRFVKPSLSRAVRGIALGDLVQVSFAKLRHNPIESDAARITTQKDVTTYVTRFLASGITINGIHYSFYGHSKHQLESRSCYLLFGSQEDVSRKREQLGNFTTTMSVAKKAKRIGQLFSEQKIGLENVPLWRCRDIEDIERNGFTFTDGCGLISPSLVQILAAKAPIVFRNQRYRPSVLQIRYRGYKGVVTVDKTMEPDLWLKFRKSMNKISGVENLSFNVIEYSKPYTYGYLNDEVILLLHFLGVPADIFAQKQAEYFELLDRAQSDPCAALRLFSAVSLKDEAEKLLIDGFETVQSSVRQTVAREYSKLTKKNSSPEGGDPKTRILIPKSRRLFGICDPYNVLEPGQCFLRVTVEGQTEPQIIKGGEVWVCRNPCLHPGDVRKIETVDHPELHHLRDCIVFSTQGVRPVADQMSGGDVDGDTFLVCWDPDLTPKKISEPADYPGAEQPPKFQPVTTKDLIVYFAEYNTTSLGRLKELYLGWARIEGPHCSQCQELNRLYSQCVDGNPIKIPKHLLDPPLPRAKAEAFILDKLHCLAHKHLSSMAVRRKKKPSHVKTKLQYQAKVVDESDRETLEYILSEASTLSQFELLQITIQWCQRNHVPFEDFWEYIDPSQLSSDEQAWLLSQLPPKFEYPAGVKNALMQFSALSKAELSTFKLDYQSLHWKCVFAPDENLRNLMFAVNATFAQYAKKLLILHLGDRFSVGIYFPNPVPRGDDFVVDDLVRLFAFPRTTTESLDHRRVIPTKERYKFYYDDNVMQLYNFKREDTFVSFMRSANDNSAYRDLAGRHNRARARQRTIDEGTNCDWRVSIALQKFGGKVQEQMGRILREAVTAAELYVINDTDILSLHAIDLWLDAIDTEEFLPNFPNLQVDYKLPMASNVNWANEPDLIRQAVRDKKFEQLTTASGVDVVRLLRFCWVQNFNEVLSEMYAYLLQRGSEQIRVSCSSELVKGLFDFLYFKPTLVVHFVRLYPWSQLPEDLAATLQKRSFDVLRALILSADRMGALVVEPLRHGLRECSISLSEAKHLIQLGALSVKSPALLLDILMEVQDSFGGALGDLQEERLRSYFLRKMFGIAIDHCEQANESQAVTQYFWKLIPEDQISGMVRMLTTHVRIDAPEVIKFAVGDHVRFTASKEPSDSLSGEPTSINVVVETISASQIKFRCLMQPPIFLEQTTWILSQCRSFATASAMADSLVKLLTSRENICPVFEHLLISRRAPSSSKQTSRKASAHIPFQDLNESQSRAVSESIDRKLTCLWGPPGTGKTITIVALLRRLLSSDPRARVLVTARTHAALDKVARQYVKRALDSEPTLPQPVRVSTDFTYVSDDLKPYARDAIFAQDFSQNHAARREAVQRISEARLVFATYVGATLGLLKKQSFETVVIEEAAQMTEPASLLLLVKGCTRVVLVGDFAQPRAIVGHHASVLDFDVSLMERLWKSVKEDSVEAIGRVMLDVQYRMHPDICRFVSTEFYSGRLMTSPRCSGISMTESIFPWPRDAINPTQSNRMAFIQCSAPEEYGEIEKVNHGQAQLCNEVVRLLTTASTPDVPSLAQATTRMATVALLTPYSRQVGVLRQQCPAAAVLSSIDGFQGQEAEIVIFVTVRCNKHGEIGLLKDLRRLNAALNGARAGLVIIGDETTLIAQQAEEPACRVWDRLIRSCSRIKLVSQKGTPVLNVTAGKPRRSLN